MDSQPGRNPQHCPGQWSSNLSPQTFFNCVWLYTPNSALRTRLSCKEWAWVYEGVSEDVPRVRRRVQAAQDCPSSSVAATGESGGPQKGGNTPRAPAYWGPSRLRRNPGAHVPRQCFVLQLRPSPHQSCQEPAWKGRGVSWDRVATQGAGLCWTRKAGRRLPSGDKDARSSWSG